jgi:hypothetical protein
MYIGTKLGAEACCIYDMIGAAIFLPRMTPPATSWALHKVMLCYVIDPNHAWPSLWLGVRQGGVGTMSRCVGTLQSTCSLHLPLCLFASLPCLGVRPRFGGSVPDVTKIAGCEIRTPNELLIETYMASQMLKYSYLYAIANQN